MFGSAFGSAVAIGIFVLTIASIYLALDLRHRRIVERRRDMRAQPDNLRYGAHIGEMTSRPSSPRPNDIT
jgi:hypothetical protein